MKKSFCFVVSSPLTVKAFFKRYLLSLSQEYHVTLVMNTNCDLDICLKLPNIIIKHVRIERKISIVRDLIALIKIYKLYISHQFDIVQSVTPKAGLLSVIAAFAAGIPYRLHIFTGQVWKTKKGVFSFILKLSDRIIGTLASHTYADSTSQLEFLKEKKIISDRKSKVVADGSVSGIDFDIFKPDTEARQFIRRQLNIPETVVLILFIGRLNLDKGVLDLAVALSELKTETEFHAVFIGPDEENIMEQICNYTNNIYGNVHFINFTNHPEKYMAASDILCLPSYREGFGNVIIEAAACQIPSIATKIYGITDAVVENETGFLYTPKDHVALREKLQLLIDNKTLREEMGLKGKKRALKMYSSDRLLKEWNMEIRSILYKPI